MLNYIYRTIIGLGVFLVCLSTYPLPILATVTIEQQINIIDQTYTTISATFAPEDVDSNQLGLIRWEGSEYNDASVYLEVNMRCDSCSGGNARAQAALYTEAGSIVSGTTVSTDATSYTLIRSSSSILANLSSGTDYTIRLKRDADNGTAYINSARLIIIQSAEDITDTQTEIEIGNYTSTTNTSYAIMSAPKLFRYDSYYYNPSPTLAFEATLKSSTDTDSASAILSSSSDCSSNISNSEVSVTGQTWDRVRSTSSFSLDSGTSYFVCLKTNANDTTAYISNAKIILNQTSTSSINSVLMSHLISPTEATINGNGYTATDYQLIFTPSHFDGKFFSYFYEANLKVLEYTGYAQLYNNNSSAAIASSELTHNSISYARKRSVELTLPTSEVVLKTQQRNSNGSSTTTSATSLLIYMFAEPELSFNVEAVPKDTLVNGITTTIASEYNKLSFGNLITKTPAYISHKLSVTTNAPGGYSVTVKLANTLQGNYPANIIEEFPTTWNSPQSWYEPTGTTPNVNTGWIGANTSDARVSGWNDASGKFGPLGSTANIVMQSTTNDPGTSVYVTYALEANEHQPTDSYAGTLIYNIVPTY